MHPRLYKHNLNTQPKNSIHLFIFVFILSITYLQIIVISPSACVLPVSSQHVVLYRGHEA